MADLPLPVWGGFLALVLLLLALDLGVFHRRRHELSLREASLWTAFWIGLGLAFMAVVFWLYEGQAPGSGTGKVQEYLTGYMLEKALSVDNLFVFLVLLRFFAVSPQDQHRVLYYGILGVLVTRGVFIFAGVAAVHAFAPTIYILAAMLIYTAVKMAFMGQEIFKPQDSRVYQFLRKWVPLSEAPHAGRFFTHEGGKRVGTTLLLCLLTVELTDVMFALDSVPAVLGVTQDAFVVYTSNVFAILGLRSLYFVLAAGMSSMRYLQPALVIVLLFIGVKMILGGPLYHFLEIPVPWALAFVGVALGTAIVASATLPGKGQGKGGDEEGTAQGEGPPPGPAPPEGGRP